MVSRTSHITNTILEKAQTEACTIRYSLQIIRPSEYYAISPFYLSIFENDKNRNESSKIKQISSFRLPEYLLDGPVSHFRISPSHMSYQIQITNADHINWQSDKPTTLLSHSAPYALFSLPILSTFLLISKLTLPVRLNTSVTLAIKTFGSNKSLLTYCPVRKQTFLCGREQSYFCSLHIEGHVGCHEKASQ